MNPDVFRGKNTCESGLEAYVNFFKKEKGTQGRWDYVNKGRYDKASRVGEKGIKCLVGECGVNDRREMTSWNQLVKDFFTVTYG